MCSAVPIPKSSRGGLCKCSRVLRPEKSSEGGLQSSASCGFENFGQMGITLPQLGNVPIGTWWNAISSVKATQKLTSNRLNSFNSLLPRQLAAGFFVGSSLQFSLVLRSCFLVRQEQGEIIDKTDTVF